MNAKIDPEDVTEPTEAATAGAAGSAQASAEKAEADAATVAATNTDVGAAAAAGAAAGAEESTPAATGEVAAVQTVYITAPQPPRRKGNRGIGALLAVLAAVVFAAVYAGIVALLILFVKPGGLEDAIGEFVTGPLFSVPALAFLVLMVLWALLANRASWWAWVIGSFVIAVLVYLVSIGVLLLAAGGFGLTASQAADAVSAFALNPAIVVAGLLAREVAVWFGAIISARGRKVRERNYDAWQAFEREEAEKRAEFAGRSAV